MKLLLINNLYTSYIEDFYNRNKGLSEKAYAIQKKALGDDAFAWNGVWNEPFEKLGFTVENICANVKPLQYTWAKENGFSTESNVLFHQIERFQPDYLFIDDIFKFDNKWIAAVKEQFPFIKLIIGYVCSPSYHVENITGYDFIFTCLEAIKNELIANNIKSAFLPHAFNSKILNELKDVDPNKEICFYGGFVRGAHWHGYREEVLTDIFNQGTQIDIYSDIVNVSVLKDFITIKSKKILFKSYSFLKAIRVPKAILKLIPFYSRVDNWEDFKAKSFDRNLKRTIKRAKYGLPLYQTMLNYRSVLNIHGDVAKNEAANMRMFEVTGAGRLLITDWKPNLHLFFEDGKEVLSFKNSKECVEKIKWAKDHPKEAMEIARAGQLRTLKEHNFDLRAESFIQQLKVHGLIG